ncbi:MAG: NUDIX domain-containing protein [Sphingomonadaceae bacterium]|nr:NUDIX domain-containing protein [Sphingomonadaceae bacterium]
MQKNTHPGIPAATLVLVRDRDGAPPDLLMVQRAKKMAFAGGAMVFPGGRIDPGDHAIVENDAIVRNAPEDDMEAAARIAAIRETLEEMGIAVGFDPYPHESAAAQMREGLHEEGDFGAMLATGGYTLDLGVMTPWARWKPNFKQERTFDTWFFVAEAPHAIDGEEDGGESIASRWAGAQQVIDDAAEGKCSIIFPTVRNLERLGQFSSFAEIKTHAESHEVKMITPWVEEREGTPWICIPDDVGYPVTGEPLQRTTRG